MTAPPLSARLAEATRPLHRRAESAGVMRDLLAGRITRERYAALLASLRAIYAAMEGALDRHAAHPAIAPIRLPGLARAAALAADLAAWSPAGAPPAPAAAALAYVARLEDLAASRPSLLGAHAYVRYLGDLSGGRILRELLQRSFARPDGRGLAFYDYGDGFDVAAAKARFRAGLDALPLGEDEAGALVDEARSAFERHVALFDDLRSG